MAEYDCLGALMTRIDRDQISLDVTRRGARVFGNAKLAYRQGVIFLIFWLGSSRPFVAVQSNVRWSPLLTCLVDGTIMFISKSWRDRMFNRKSLAYFGITLLCLAGLVQAWVFKEGQHWPIWVWLPLLVIGLGSLWVIRDPPDPKAKAFDFNPRRGAFYFLAGFVIFPIIAVINAIFGAELSIASMAGFTVIGSCFAGIAGTFTEHTGI